VSADHFLVYKITNKIDGMIYIGQTTQRIISRVLKHIRYNRFYIGKALNKYGIDSFDISIVDIASSKKELNEKEIYWIKKFDCKSPNGYNLTDGGEGCFNPTKETRLRMSKSHVGHIGYNKGKVFSEATRKKMSEAMKKRKLSPEHIKNMSESLKGRKSPMEGKHHTDSTKKKISDAKLGIKDDLKTRKKKSEGMKLSWKRRKKLLNGN
jgi:hypothetical protein